MTRLLLALLACFIAFPAVGQDSTEVCFDFTSTRDSGRTYTGNLRNGARLTTLEGIPILDLGENNGYFDFGAAFRTWLQTFDDYTISLDMFLPLTTEISANVNFIWCFAKSSSEGYCHSHR